MSPIDSPAPIATPIPVPVQPPQLSITKSVTPQPRPTPPPPPPASPAPSPTVSRSRQSMPSVSQDTINNAAAAAQLNAMANLGNLGNLGGNVNASLLQAFHQQVFRGSMILTRVVRFDLELKFSIFFACRTATRTRQFIGQCTGSGPGSSAYDAIQSAVVLLSIVHGSSSSR